MKHAMGLYEEPFESIKTGKKVYEVRLYDEKRRKINVGDVIEFTRIPENGETLEVEVLELCQYNTFREMYEAIPFSLFDCEGWMMEEMLDGTYEVYTKEQEKQWGTLAIKVKQRTIEDIASNWRMYCIDRNFIGIGSTRKVYRVGKYVVKIHKHPIGYKQSLNELEIYTWMVEAGLSELFAKTYYVDENITIQQYVEQLELRNNQCFEIDIENDQALLPPHYEEVYRILDEKFDSFDLKDSSNYGLDIHNKLVFIDYGMTKKLYEDEWVPLAESGVLPQMELTTCSECGLEKEIRVYGENDTDKRCYACGKE
ncbi:ASC-1-like (ASCH) protein [Priestia taiwanensis]|uniref:ASCH domain-containing protein n=1 Tax=Priestia taiwanensis TaxID=1347902 RepID=A0A917ERS7_9BACI|nr:ASC-1-like (ASCH) protein [Priestia taiwanensis]GGE71113.1 hypothetical protein GCM10007140_21230 [Priestia taiwanensis]